MKERYPGLQKETQEKDQAIQILQGEVQRQSQQNIEMQKRMEVMKSMQSIKEAEAKKMTEIDATLREARLFLKQAKSKGSQQQPKSKKAS